MQHACPECLLGPSCSATHYAIYCDVNLGRMSSMLLQDLQLANSTLAQQLVRMQAEGGEVNTR